MFLILSLVFCLLGIFEGRSPNPVGEMLAELQARDEQNREPEPATHVLLRDAPEMFRASLFLESPDFPIEEMVKTKAWAELQKEVTAYDQKLEIRRDEITKERRRAFDRLMALSVKGVRNRARMAWLSILSTIGFIVFLLLDVPNMRRALAEARAAKAAREDGTAKGP